MGGYVFISSKNVTKKLPALFSYHAANGGGVTFVVKVVVGDGVWVKYPEKDSKLFSVERIEGFGFGVCKRTSIR